MRKAEDLIPYQKTKAFVRDYKSKFEELKNEGNVVVYGCLEANYNRDDKSYSISCYPNTEKININNPVIITWFITITVIIDHLIEHIEQGYDMGKCPQCLEGLDNIEEQE